ncbi:hypothetical protein [uncultured Chloroflexus sp.]|uniref:hypothetical protein n=1 Tax=uncultured Chloroflexus sp. TaxID=214040 RepID=UPI00263A29BE|nr:hypothetical protein [uncultured Chloroflexus sp.]
MTPNAGLKRCGYWQLTISSGTCAYTIYGDDAPIIQGAVITTYDGQILFLAHQRGYRITEVPVSWHDGTETKVDLVRYSWRNLRRDVLRVRFNDWRGAYQAPLLQSADSNLSGDDRRLQAVCHSVARF